MSDTIAPDVIATGTLVLVVLVGLGVLRPVALAACGGSLSLAAFLYRRRS